MSEFEHAISSGLSLGNQNVIQEAIVKYKATKYRLKAVIYCNISRFGLAFLLCLRHVHSKLKGKK